jgi:predicted RNase H-like HicB family nuclease
MLIEYIDKAMKLAKYEIMEDDEGYFGTIPGFQGLWASDKTLEGCREELKSTLGDWLLLKLWDNDDDIPVVRKLSLVPRRRSVRRRREAASQPA